MESDERHLEQTLESAGQTVRSPAYRGHALLVAGMHRTGTSAMTRVLGLCGIDLPRHLAPGVAGDNDPGFWESVPIMEAHDRFLASVGSSWDDVSPIPLSTLTSSKAQEFADELVKILRAEYGNSTLFVVKDPRLCRLIPVWVAALESLGARPSFVITTRNPLEVAGSLRARQGFSATKSCLLWLRHVLDAERDSRGFTRVFVSYEQLLRDWVSETDRIARELHLFWPRSDHETHLEIENFLSSALRHHSFDHSELRTRSDITEWVKQVFEVVSSAARGSEEIDSELLDEVHGQLDRADHAYGPLLAQAKAEISSREAARDEVESQLAAASGVLARREDELSSLRADNQLVIARLVEGIETEAVLRRVVDGLANAIDQLGQGFGDAEAELLAAERDALMLRTTFEQPLGVLRRRPSLHEEPEGVRDVVESAIARIDEFLRVLDEDRTRLVAALAEGDSREAQRIRECETLNAEALRLAEALATRESELATALGRAETAEADALAEAEALGLALLERDELAAHRSRLAEEVNERDALLSERTREYDGLRVEARHLAAALADAETQLADTRVTLAKHSAELDDARRTLDAVSADSDAAASDLRAVVAERDSELARARSRLEAVETEMETLSIGLEQADRDREAWREEGERLRMTLTEQGEALTAAQAESAQLTRTVTEQEQRLERLFKEASTLAAALAEREEALSYHFTQLRDRDDRLHAAVTERVTSDELLARRSEQLDGLSSELRVRDEALATQSELLARLEAIGRMRGRRWRSFSQFCSWLFPPTAAHLRYVKAYLHLRHSDRFDADDYLARYPDVSLAGLNPLMHYIEHGRREGRQAAGSYKLPFIQTPPPMSAPPAALALPEGDPAIGLRQALADRLPTTAVIAVAAGGDEYMPSLAEYKTCHFPRGADGSHAGYTASGETALIANLEAARATGVEFLYVPASQPSLLARNPRFSAHTLSRYLRVLESEELGLCLALHTPDQSTAWRRKLADLVEWIERETTGEASILDWDADLQLGDGVNGCNVIVFSDWELPHLDGSVDVVAVTLSSEERLAEARRVARYAVLEVPADGAPPSLTLLTSLTERAPSVSIIVPCHEQFAYTQACVRAIGETLPMWFRGEIIIVDDGSSSGTVADLQQLAVSTPYVRLITNDANSGFLASVNHAVEEASCELVVLLNNDTIPLPGWLHPLLAPFRTRDDVGAIGGRLVYPDGRLQEAGGLIFSDGSAAKFGYGDTEPDFPLFTVPREVDYCSGCLLAFRRDFFLESGGFDPAYGFGFYEDADFCFRARALGRIVLYEPESVVVHVEGASAGTDLTQGAKRYQALNASLFAERWHDALAGQFERPSELDRKALQHLARRNERR
jgi:GT2 family glycosyltransferase